MKRFIFTMLLLAGGITTAAMAQDPIGVDPAPVDTVTPVPADTITVYGSGGVIAYPDGTNKYCPNPGKDMCAQIIRPRTGREVIVYGSGGVRELPDGTTVYCPDPGTNVCARIKLADAVRVGAITVKGADPTEVSIYNMDGLLLNAVSGGASIR